MFTGPEIVNFIFYMFYDTQRSLGYAKFDDWRTPINAINKEFLALMAATLKMGVYCWPFGERSHHQMSMDT